MEWLEKIRSKFILSGLLLIAMGVLVVWKPGMVFNGIVYLVAAYFAFMGLLNLYTVLREKPRDASAYASGVLLLLVALGVIVLAKTIVSIIPFFLGLMVLLAGIRQLRQELALNKVNQGRLSWLIFGLLLCIAGVVLMFNPFRSVLLLFQLFGGILIVYGISQLINSKDL